MGQKVMMIYVILMILVVDITAVGMSCDDAPDCQVKKDANGKANGTEVCGYGDGRIKREAQYRDGELDGVWKCYNDKGKVITERHYKMGKLHGLEKQLIPEIDRYSECTYQEDVLSGSCKNFFSETSQGKTKVTGSMIVNYKGGSKHGWEIEFDQNQKELRRICYQDSQLELEKPELCGSIGKGQNVKVAHKLNGLHERKNNKGILLSAENFKSDQLHGEAKYFNHKGQLLRVAHFENGVLKGQELSYFDSGAKKEKAIWAGQGDLESQEKYFENGFLQSRLVRIKKAKGLEPDLYRFQNYFDNGKLASESSCWVSPLDSTDYCFQFEGQRIEYDRQGKKLSECQYKEGKEHGDCIYFVLDKTTNRRLIQTLTYDQGRKTKFVEIDADSHKQTQLEEYFSDGSVKRK